jgi:hypothetical protein
MTSRPGSPKFGASNITGVFSWDTVYATANLQDRWDIGVDGDVGKQTFGRADDELKKTGGSISDGKKLDLQYEGDEHTFSVVRNTEGKYSFRDGDDKWRIAGYNFRTCR